MDLHLTAIRHVAIERLGWIHTAFVGAFAPGLTLVVCPFAGFGVGDEGHTARIVTISEGVVGH